MSSHSHYKFEYAQQKDCDRSTYFILFVSIVLNCDR